MAYFKKSGPGVLVAAAFIGPGTVTICTISGASFGYALLWGLFFSVVTTIVLQEMSLRLGLIARKGLAETIREQLQNKWLRLISLLLVFGAIIFGNLAYEAGNISGGALGVELLFGSLILPVGTLTIHVAPALIGSFAFFLLFQGNFQRIERGLIFLVGLMSFSFLITAFLVKPLWSDLIKGLFIPTLPEGGLLTVVGLIGTTVVPYNLFLHAALVRKRWQGVSDLSSARKDSCWSISLGGVISLCIVISAASVPLTGVKGIGDLALGLEPLFGNYARLFLGFGMLAAGLTSAITAPLAAALVASEIFGWSNKLSGAKFRGVWMSILLLGVLFSTTEVNLIKVIKWAQLFNGLLLPIVAIFLVWIVNKKTVLGDKVNTVTQNAFAFFVITITLFLGMKGMLSFFS